MNLALEPALVAAVFGLLDFLTIPQGTRAFATARKHVVLNAVMVVLFAIDFAWRAGDHLDHDKTPWGQLALSAVSVAFLVAAAWFGGKLTYHHGMRVAAQIDQPTASPTIGTK